MHPVTAEVTERIVERSRETRADYLARMEAARSAGTGRAKLSCANWAHAFAAESDGTKATMRDPTAPNIAIVSAYNDMLSAHQPLERFPAIIKQAAREVGAAAQYAGGVPAMCDGVTQGRPGMELSLFSRDVIAMATAVALTHDAFDAALMLGICDKIVPGLTMGALSFGHLPVIFVPGGPMTSGVSNHQKAAVRARYAQGQATREELLDSEMASYHGQEHLHLLRHRQLQPDDDGDDRSSSAGLGLRPSQHAVARRARRGGPKARGRDPRRDQRLHADGPGGG